MKFNITIPYGKYNSVKREIVVGHEFFHISNTFGEFFFWTLPHQLQSVKQNIEKYGITNYDFIKNISGPFIIIFSGKEEIGIAISLYKTLDCFYSITQQGLKISSSFKEMAFFINNKSINLEYCRRFVLGEELFDTQTVYNEINTLPLGSVGIWRVDNFQTEISSIELPTPPDSIIDYLSLELAEISKFYENRVLSFSGGLDSSLLMYALKKRNVDFIAEHNLPFDIEDSDESKLATQVANYFECNIKFNEQAKYNKISLSASMILPINQMPNAPDLVNIFEIESKQILENRLEFKSLNKAKTIKITGHGGDHLFLENPPLYSGLDSLLSGKLLKTLRVSWNIACLHGVPINRVFAELLKKWYLIMLVNLD